MLRHVIQQALVRFRPKPLILLLMSALGVAQASETALDKEYKQDSSTILGGVILQTMPSEKTQTLTTTRPIDINSLSAVGGGIFNWNWDNSSSSKGRDSI